MKNKTCTCDFCVAHKKYKWAVVMNCGCGCHTGDGLTGHEGLCCEIPNALKKNNPYPELENKEVAKQVIIDFETKFRNEDD